MKLMFSMAGSACALALCSSAWLVAHAGALEGPSEVAGSVIEVAAAASEAPAQREATAPTQASALTAPAAVSVEAPVTVVAGWGAPLAGSRLEDFRGGSDLVSNNMQLSGTVAGNSATNVVTGINSIADGAFANMTGLPMVIQNSGSNVLIQNATIINVQFQ